MVFPKPLDVTVRITPYTTEGKLYMKVRKTLTLSYLPEWYSGYEGSNLITEFLVDQFIA